MSAVRAPVADAAAVIRDLNEGRWNAQQGEREIDVSFRYPNRAVGRRDSATHWIHSYPAKMFHRIPSVFLDTIELPTKASILDPFCGSGTVLLEANIRGHHAIGIDINPLARLISRVKTTPLDPSCLEEHLRSLLPRARRSRSSPPPQSTLDSWLSVPARRGLHRITVAIADIDDAAIRAFFLVTLTSIVRRVSAADPAVPPLVRLREERASAAGARYRKALRRSRSITTSSVYSAFADAGAANIRRMSELHALRHGLGRTRLPELGTDAASTGLPPGSIDAIITSPPYCGAQKYVRSLKLELLLSGCCTENDLRRPRPPNARHRGSHHTGHSAD